jgi:uncharacterized protein (UPF0218 family)
VLRLPDSLRDAFAEPFGPVYTDVEALLAAAGEPIVSVGDVVTHHLLAAGYEPAVAVLDAHTERRPVRPEVRRAAPDPDRTVRNEPGTLSRDLLVAVREAVDGGAPVVLRVEGEEDLSALPAILAVPEGGSVVYGQPGEGMVLVTVDPATRERARDLLARMDGDADAALDLLT